jgi:hypothetical protein
MRQVCALERFIDLDQRELLDQIGGPKVWAKQLEIVCRQR